MVNQTPFGSYLDTFVVPLTFPGLEINIIIAVSTYNYHCISNFTMVEKSFGRSRRQEVRLAGLHKIANPRRLLVC